MVTAPEALTLSKVSACADRLPNNAMAKAKPIFGAAGKTITPQDIAVFSRQLATMMQSGIPMVQAFGIVSGGQKNIRMQNLLENIGSDIASGTALSEALSKHPLYFDKLYQNLVFAGENAGDLLLLVERDVQQEAWPRLERDVAQLFPQRVALVDAKRGEMVADFCAGAGGKTLALGASMRNTGRLYAFDTSAHRLEGLKPRLARSSL